ncbi:unnamed protein product [Didymodactylos carnosus]|uniref:UDP-N-acetylglucosamine transferase subunit ALG13 n=1 Tax=Didymodactylos carnosus TaxID=1234261 RepID=A0A813NS52_9BILA|nr:unnamed protein product [Didymodactylos carnosus]CAF0763207.1 unnamed protein product [Didymodactylos carnosus]CAF3517950.1 unnamed protein product [Didymodactylos carnosus]CAF3543166.1 unnamed protein product [Didymodactylos carnosus]
MVQERVLNELKNLNIKHLLLQVGDSDLIDFPLNGSILNDVYIEYYKFKDSLDSDIDKADLIVSHAGAGSILQCLEAKKRLLVVVNETLMNNHQLEIAEEMEKQGYLFYCTCSTLQTTLKKFQQHQFRAYERGNPTLFGRYVNQIMLDN